MKQINWVITMMMVVAGVFIFFASGCDKPANDIASASPGAGGVALPATALSDKANGIVDKLAAGDFAAVTQNFDATMKAALPETALQQTWASLTQQTGPFKNRGSARSTTEQGFDVVYVECIFERATMSTKVVFSPAGEVTGLFIQKG
ncbi:MAG: DUF3887 domain-containing protein [Candidatus Hydrogenedentes bacterium]|nr:DUF3887 domain-containing protein [Candidatus Hydrogenedentota bacterium]